MSVAKGITIGTVLLIVLAIFSWTFGWFTLPLEVTSKQNVKKQWSFVYQYDEGLKAAARKVCSAQKVLNESETTNERQQRRSHLLALEQNYARIQAEYNAKLRNAFEAKYVAPNDVPKTAPELGATLKEVCP